MNKNWTIVLLCFLFYSSYGAVKNVPGSYITIQSALNACSVGDTVLVQPGTYFENITWPAQADIKLLSAGDSSNTIIDANDSSSVLTISYYLVNQNTIIKGFRISGGYVIGNSVSTGAGINIIACGPRLEELSITHNHINCADGFAVGAGLYGENSDAMIINCSISNNVIDSATHGYGGGVGLAGAGTTIFQNVKIIGNLVNSRGWAHGGGVMVVSGPSPYFSNVLIEGNSTNNYVTTLPGTFNGGAGVYCLGYPVPIPNVSFHNVKVINNYSGDNADFYYGMGIYFWDCYATLTNVLISSNVMGTAPTIFTSYTGGGIAGDANTTINLTNVTVADNKRADGGIIVGSGISLSSGAMASIKNCVLWNNNPAVEEVDTLSNNGGSLNIFYSNVRGGFGGTGNINANPQFISPTDFHLQNNSPCINAGTISGAPINDLDYNVRPSPAGTNPDMGCYEMSQPVFINDVNKESLLVHFFPNPSTNYLVIEGHEKMTTATLEIEDTAGRIVFHKKLSLEKIARVDDIHLPDGVYMLHLFSGSESYRHKQIIKTHQ